jgi:hypothetical protein
VKERLGGGVRDEAEREIKSEGGNIAISTIFRVRVSFETRNPRRVSGDMRYDITQYGVRGLKSCARATVTIIRLQIEAPRAEHRLSGIIV